VYRTHHTKACVVSKLRCASRLSLDVPADDGFLCDKPEELGAAIKETTSSLQWGRDSSVGIATGYGLDGPGIESKEATTHNHDAGTTCIHATPNQSNYVL
jgi:hypothetical protein